MNDDPLVRRLSQADSDLGRDDTGKHRVDGVSIRNLAARRRSVRTRATACAVIVIAGTVSTWAWWGRLGQDSPRRTDDSVSLAGTESANSIDSVPMRVSIPSTGRARVGDAGLDFQVETERESIAMLLADHARFRRSKGVPESEWRQDLEFVLQLYPGSLAAESIRSDFADVLEGTN